MNDQMVNDSVRIETAGSLSSIFSTVGKFEIIHLSLSGSMNGVDFKFIRQMTELYSLKVLGSH